MAGLKLPNNPKKRRGRAEQIPRYDECQRRLQLCANDLQPGTFVNSQCPARMRGQTVIRQRPDLEEEAAARQRQRAEAAEKQRKLDREVVLAEERRLMGIKSTTQQGEGDDDEDFGRPSQAFLDYMKRKSQTHLDWLLDIFSCSTACYYLVRNVNIA
ncbi:hypothetical protein ElyMa_006338600 [Elysia marginata]|uniref:Uncharacterized protein n=1 Tax=Elysia marginata TaxID=1093978 RepID=A0AAV4HN34_9GAST|nr:hypothetical protein ElyMa_006338600 [Elysia marginata]